MFRRSYAFLMSLLLPLVCLSTQGRADSFQLYVGYADSLRPSGFFPAPFAGSPNVVYSGLSTNNSLDSGALRIDDTGATPLTITNLTVTLNPGTGPIVFALWGSVTLTPGQIGIYAQTKQYNFDTSDDGFLGVVGIDSAHPLGGCTNPGALTAAQQHECIINSPLVTFDVNGKEYSYIDSGNVLNTFGYDFIYGSSDGNESINWNTIGAPVNRGGNTPEPASLALLGTGLICALGVSRMRRSRS